MGEEKIGTEMGGGKDWDPNSKPSAKFDLYSQLEKIQNNRYHCTPNEVEWCY